MTDLLALRPRLHAFAIALTRNGARAEDLVQETLARALKSHHQYSPDTSLAAWTFTIMRNFHFSAYRKARREVEDADGAAAESLVIHPTQQSRLDLEDFCEALDQVPRLQREALMFVFMYGYTYEETAEATNTTVGTVKSRVSRARTRLIELLGDKGFGDYVVLRSGEDDGGE